MARRAIKLTTDEGEICEEYLAQLALLDHIMGKYKPRKCVQDKELGDSLMKLFKISKSELAELACNLEFYRASITAGRDSDLALARVAGKMLRFYCRTTIKTAP